MKPRLDLKVAVDLVRGPAHGLEGAGVERLAGRERRGLQGREGRQGGGRGGGRSGGRSGGGGGSIAEEWGGQRGGGPHLAARTRAAFGVARARGVGRGRGMEGNRKGLVLGGEGACAQEHAPAKISTEEWRRR